MTFYYWFSELQWHGRIQRHTEDLYELTGVYPERVCESYKTCFFVFLTYATLVQLEILASHDKVALTGSNQMSVLSSFEFMVKQWLYPVLEICWNHCFLGSISKCKESREKLSCSECIILIWCITSISACETEAGKVCQLSLEEHIQPFKDNMEKFINQGN